jgi:CRISPR-associated protein Csd1
VATEGGPPPLGYAEVQVVGALDISEAGELLQLQDLRREAIVGKKTRPVPGRRMVPQPPIRTNTAVRAGFLCDHAGYLLGHAAKGNAKRAADQFAAARVLHEVVLGDVNDPAAGAVLEFFRRWDPDKADAFLAREPDEMSSGWLVLRDADIGGFFHEMPAIRDGWLRYLATMDAPSSQCLVTGRYNQLIALVHPPSRAYREHSRRVQLWSRSTVTLSPPMESRKT